MPLDTDVFAADRAAIMADLPCSIDHGEDTGLTGMRGDINKEDDLELGGYHEDFALLIEATKGDFTATPVRGDDISVDGVAFQVMRTVDTPDGGFLIGCGKVT